jgi:tetratricopeptide (TPR) repeat protein
MDMRLVTALAGLGAAAILAVPALPAGAQTSEQLKAQCANTKVQSPIPVRIKSCSDLLSAGLETQELTGIVYFNRGNAYYDQKDFRRAAADYEEAGRLAPSIPHILDYIADCYIGLEDHDRALAIIAKIKTLDQNGIDAIYDTALKHARSGDLKIAIAYFDQVLRLSPKDAEALSGRGLALAKSGETDRALADLDKALLLNPKLQAAWNNRGLARNQAGRYRDAIADLDTAIKMDARDEMAFNNRGNSYLALADFKRALADYDEALRIDPNEPMALANRCFTRAAALTRMEEALADCEASLKASNQPHTVEYRAFARFRLGQLNEALADCNAAIAKDKDLTTCVYLRGIIRLKLGDQVKGRADIAEANRRNPDIAREFESYGVKP